MDKKISKEHLQSFNKSVKIRTKQKNDKTKGTITQSTRQKKIEGAHSIVRVWYTPDVLQPCTQTYSIYNSVLSGFHVSLSAQSMSLRESLGWSNQRGSKTSQACYSYPGRNLNFVRFFHLLSLLPLPVFGRLLLFLYPRGNKLTASFTYCAIPDPTVHRGYRIHRANKL